MSRRKPKLSRKRRILRAAYRVLVTISSLIVAVYIALQIAIRPPEIVGAVDTNNTDGQTDITDMPAGRVRKEQCYTFLLAASDDGNGNADTIMLITYDVPNKKIGVVSVPRDTLVNHKFPKINALYASGIDTLRQELIKIVGYPIDYYINVDMQAFVEVVDTVGGIDFEVPIDMDYDDPTQDLAIHFQQGMQHLDGADALRVARNRHGYPIPDLGRIQTQQHMIQALADKIISFQNVTKVKQLVTIFKKYVDTNLSVQNMLFFATNAVSLNVDSDVTMNTFPGDGEYAFRGQPYCYRVFPEESLVIINETLNPYTEPLTMEDIAFFQGKG